MYETLLKQITVKVKLEIGAVFLLTGIIFQLCSEKELDMFAFYFMSAMVLCLVNIIMCRVSKGEIDIILFLVLNMAVVITGFALITSDNLAIETSMGRIGVGACCVMASWIINAVLNSNEDILKKMVLGFVTTILNVLSIAIIFVGAVLIRAFVG